MTYRNGLDLDDSTLAPQDRFRPAAWRLIAAFGFAPLVAAFVFSAVTPMYAGLPGYWDRVFRTLPLVAVLGGYLPVLLFGIPAYLFARKHVRVSWLSCAIFGAIVACLPWALLTVGSQPDSASINGHMTVIDGTLTAYGWLESGRFLSMVASFGAVGGLMFRIILAAGGRSKSRIQN